MAEYIDREKAIETIRLTYCKDCNNYNGVRCRACEFDDAMMEIEDCPTADVVEVRHGEWKICSDGYYPYCSRCRYEPEISTRYSNNLTPYCPNCGAKMDGERKEQG